MVSRNIQHAEVKLTPPHLGPLEIRLNVQNDQANVTFLATHATTREALEAAIPRLREMFGEANLNLANVDVGHRDSSQTGSEQASDSGGRKYSHLEDGGGGMTTLLTSALGHSMSDGLVDDYA